MKQSEEVHHPQKRKITPLPRFAKFSFCLNLETEVWGIKGGGAQAVAWGEKMLEICNLQSCG